MTPSEAAPDGPSPGAPTPRRTIVNGLRLAWHEAGPSDAPALVLVHGLLESHRTWDPHLEPLAADHRVLAVDLLGHGDSSKPAVADYSVPALATHLRDLLLVAGVGSATLVGHSLGGGVAMQLSYLWPELVDRLVLVSSGGLGRSVSPLLRLLALPGPIGWVLDLTVSPRTAGWLRAAVRTLPGIGDEPKVADVLRAVDALADRPSRRAVLRLVRGVIDLGGQRVDALDRLHLAGRVPALVMWGEEDRIIPAGHARRAEAMIPGSRVHVLADAGHWPHLDRPEAFRDALREFLRTTEPAERTARELIEEVDTVPVPHRRGGRP